MTAHTDKAWLKKIFGQMVMGAGTGIVLSSFFFLQYDIIAIGIFFLGAFVACGGAVIAGYDE